MRTDRELFAYIRHKSDYITLSGDLQFKVEVSEEDGRVYCFFEESTSREDWRTNLRFFAKPWKSGLFKVHGGYRDVYMENREAVMQTMELVCAATPGYKPTFCGWSYGGAVAVLAAVDFAERGNERPLLVTFGAPKVAKGRPTARYFRMRLSEARQHEVNNDFVPKCPPFPFWRHVDATIRHGDRFSLLKCMRETEHCHTNYDAYMEG